MVLTIEAGSSAWSARWDERVRFKVALAKTPSMAMMKKREKVVLGVPGSSGSVDVAVDTESKRKSKTECQADSESPIRQRFS
jgi:hypothetical protein